MRMIRPKIMYIEAANKVGANSAKSVDPMKGPVDQLGVWEAEYALKAYPRTSTKFYQIKVQLNRPRKMGTYRYLQSRTL
jgi:hypothetical protein